MQPLCHVSITAPTVHSSASPCTVTRSFHLIQDEGLIFWNRKRKAEFLPVLTETLPCRIPSLWGVGNGAFKVSENAIVRTPNGGSQKYNQHIQTTDKLHVYHTIACLSD